MLRKAGYATAIAGKWQIDDFRVEPRALEETGFDAWCMWTGGEGGNPKSDSRYWDPYIHQGTESRTRQGKFGPDIYCDFLIEFMRAHRGQPMLLSFPMALTHTPLVTTPDQPDAAGNLDKHKAMVRYADKLVARLTGALEELNLREDTIIFFTTDNGTSRAVVGKRLGREVKGAKSRMIEAGTAMPLIVNCPGRVPAGVVTDALTDFTDILPTFAELAGTTPDPRFPSDGLSIAPLLLGQAKDSGREWIVSLGGGPATFDNNRVVPVEAFDDRVVRDKRWKLWVGTDRRATALYDLENDPWETRNLLDSTSPQAQAAKRRLWSVVQQMPQRDAAPQYRPNPPQPWDKFEYRTPDDSD
jgi:arylsulfatase A-like enzyme